MRINGNFFNFMNSSFFNRSSVVSRLFGSRHAGNVHTQDRNRVDKHFPPHMEDGVFYQKGHRPESKLYTRQGTFVGASSRQAPNRRNAFRPFHSEQEALHSQVIHGTNPKQVSVKDNEVHFESHSYYEFTDKDGKAHTVFSLNTTLSTDTYADFDQEAADYVDFWGSLASGNTSALKEKYSQSEIRDKLEEAGIQNGFFTVGVGKSSQTYYLSQNKDVDALFSKEEYDKQYNALTSGKAFELDDFQPGQTVTVGGKDYVLKDDKSLDIEYGAELYSSGGLETFA